MARPEYEQYEMEMPEKSEFNNAKGYFYIITKVMMQVVNTSLEKDLQNYLNALYELYGLLIGHFKGKSKSKKNAEEKSERQKLYDYFEKAQQQINDYNINTDKKNYNDSRTNYNNARKTLDGIKHVLYSRMHTQNLLAPLKENILEIEDVEE